MSSFIIAAPKIRELHLKVTGHSGLICHHFSDKSRKQIEDVQAKVAKGPKEARDPQAEYEGAFYKLEGGGYGFPCSGFKKSAIRAAKMLDGVNMTDARQMFFVEADDRDTTGVDCVRIEGTPEMRTDTVRLSKGVADLRYRPEFRDWSCTLKISYDEDLISGSQLVNLFSRAGLQVGVGDWRPEKDGDFGRFVIGEQQALDADGLETETKKAA
jgi:hypothetical protein|tara:strand:+ start:283 stop:921 length:639 start_codon:yes stop_codon:yes gene_type:complete